MKTKAKSSITLQPEDLRLVVALQVKLRAKSKVELVRRRASAATRANLDAELADLDHLASEGLDAS